MANGLGNLPFTWSDAGVDLSDDRLTELQKAGILGVLSGHDPLRPATLSAAAQATLDFAAFRFPDPATVDAAIDAVANLADAKAVLRKLAKAVYYLARATGVDH